MKHGGDLLTYRHLYEGDIIDFSSNINPLGPPVNLKNGIVSEFDNITAYPDIEYRFLKEALSKYLKCSTDEVMLGNGAVEIIHNVATMFDRVIIPIPCFSEYIERPKILGKEIIKLHMNEAFMIDDKLIGSQIQKGDLIILGNPNNPTGRRIHRKVLMNIHEKAQEVGAFLLLDEAFYEFCLYDYDSISLFYGSSNICVIRAATKFFALPGIRLGYAYANKEFVNRYNNVVLPWNINTFAEVAGRVILKDEEYITRTKKYMAIQRKYMLSQLKKFNKISVFETDCNYILIKLNKGNEEDIFKFMIQKGILIREASSFEGLDHRYIRVAIKNKSDNRYLIECMKEYLQ